MVYLGMDWLNISHWQRLIYLLLRLWSLGKCVSLLPLIEPKQQLWLILYEKRVSIYNSASNFWSVQSSKAVDIQLVEEGIPSSVLMPFHPRTTLMSLSLLRISIPLPPGPKVMVLRVA